MRSHLPDLPGKRYETWDPDDPAGQDLTAVRAVRADVRHRVEHLLTTR
jgi:arsenate reductase